MQGEVTVDETIATFMRDKFEVEYRSLADENQRLRDALGLLAERGCVVDSLVASISLKAVPSSSCCDVSS